MEIQLLFSAGNRVVLRLASVVVKGNETISTAVDEMLAGKTVQFGSFLVYLLMLTGADF